eukprot:CAMPEP_0175102446 /NCGR_PEP_ID=MMETSP0086_2-20121207/8451_1 /TAXON_ID=136419 /ORGANISM="Unknown Unknown, Strain D1" /LENGTH=625 /DNA_ID=CAMNT_0016377277 /DNA_START=29 /DNA_END=1906 /DNA_ORIENTATION=-
MPAKKKSNKGRKGSNKGKRKPSTGTRKSARLEAKNEAAPDTEDVTMVDVEQEKKVEQPKASEPVPMTDDNEDQKEDAQEEEIIDKRKLAMDEVKSNIHLLAQAVKAKDNLLFLRVMRHINTVRKKLTPAILTLSVQKYSEGLQAKYLAQFKAAVDQEEAEEVATQAKIKAQKEKAEQAAAEKKAKEEAERLEKEVAARKGKEPTKEEVKAAEEKAKKDKEEEKKQAAAAARTLEKAAMREREDVEKDQEAKTLPEVQVYMHLLCVVFLWDKDTKNQAATCAEDLVGVLQSHNRRTLDQLSAKVWHYYSLTQEALGQLESIRNKLLLAHRTACLQHNEPGQAALIVAILRNYLSCKLYNQADKFRLNSTFPESRSNNLFSRYLYYVGQINSIQLNYSEAYANLNQAIRKAPQNTALGFRIKATKLMVIVQLLIGEVPERSLFRQVSLKDSLQPYFELTQAVRVGNPLQFEQVSAQYKSVWVDDNLVSLIDRLRNNVIKTGLRKINLSYSRISIKDICAKLNFESLEDAEHVVAKAIHDGVIDAVIDRENGYLSSKENTDVYSSYEPQGVFHKRIQFCNDIHNEAVKAMRFPPNAHKSDAEKENDDLRDNENAINEALAEAEAEEDD